MPFVPGGSGPDSYSIPTGAIDARQVSLDPSAGAQGVQALVGLGDKMQQAQQQTSDTVIQLQQMKDQADVANKVDQYQKAANANYAPGGLFTLQGKNAIDAYPQAMKNLEDTRQSLLAGAGSPYERAALEESLNEQQRMEYRTMDMFYGDQVRKYHDESLTALSDTAANTGALNWNNPQAVQTAVDTATHAATLQAQVQGLSSVASQDYILQTRSKTAAQILDAAMVHDPNTAMGLYNQFMKAGDLDAATSAEVGARLRRATMPGAINSISNTVLSNFNAQNTTGGMDSASMTPPTSAQAGSNPINNPGNLRAVGATSGFMQYPTMQDGLDALQNDLVTKNKPTADGGDGLSSLAQIITKYAPPGDNNDTASYITQVAAAAGIKDPNAPIDLVDDKELRAKVMSAIIQREGDMPGNVPTPDDLMENLPQLQQQARQLAEQQYPDQPDAGDLAADKVYSQVLLTKNAYDTQQKGSLDTVINTIDANKITDPSQLLQLGGTPATAWLDLSPQYQQGALALMKKNVPGADDSWTPQRAQTYYTLLGQAVTNPTAFAKVNLMDPTIIGNLTHNMLSDLMDRQASIGKSGSAAHGLMPDQINSAIAWVKPMIAGAAINVKNPDDPNYQQFVGAYAQDIQSYVDKNGKIPDAVDQQKIAQRLLVQGYSGTGGLFFGAKGERLYQAEGPSGIDPAFSAKIPSAALAQINAAYQKATGKPPDLKTATAIYLQQMAPDANGQEAQQ